jgi:hypothetical protein
LLRVRYCLFIFFDGKENEAKESHPQLALRLPSHNGFLRRFSKPVPTQVGTQTAWILLPHETGVLGCVEWGKTAEAILLAQRQAVGKAFLCLLVQPV